MGRMAGVFRHRRLERVLRPDRRGRRPVLLLANGVDPRDFDANQQSKYLVEVQLIETVETFAVLWLLLRKFVQGRWTPPAIGSWSTR